MAEDRSFFRTMKKMRWADLFGRLIRLALLPASLVIDIVVALQNS
jgi:hypothetical protein